jgi:ankyrin repeat protein
VSTSSLDDEEWSAERMQLVPTLLQLAGFVKDSIPVTSTYSEVDVVDWKPLGDHPLVLAWDICVACDAQLVWRNGGVVACSELTILTAYLLARHLRFFHPDLKVNVLFKVEGWMLSTTALPANHFLCRRIAAFVRQHDDRDEEMCSLFERAANEKRWDVVLATANRYGSHAKAAYFCAHGGNLELLEYCLWTSECGLSSFFSSSSSPLTLAVAAAVASAADRRGANNAHGHLLGGLFDGEVPLHWAASGGSVEAVEYLLRRNPLDVNAVSCSGRTPLYMASIRGHANVVAVLLEHGADVNVKVARNHGSTPLIAACSHGHLAVAELLLAHRAINLHGVTTKGRSALHVASADGWLDIVKLLVLNKASLNLADDEGRTPLLGASRNGHFGVVRHLLEHGADENCHDMYRQTPLFIASEHGHAEIVRLLLLSHKVDVNVTTVKGCTALMAACIGGHLKVIGWLLDFEADVNDSDDTGKTALHYACQSGSLDAVQHLLRTGRAERDVADANGETPLFIAAASGHVEIVEYLLFKKASVNTRSKEGATPLFAACRAGHLRVVTALINAGADVNAACLCEEDANAGLLAPFQGFTPLLIACFENRVEVVKFLLDNNAVGVNLGAVTKDGWTLAMLAAARGNLECLQVVPSPMLTLATMEGLTAVHIAKWMGHEDIFRFLVDEQGCSLDGSLSHPLWQCNAHDKCSLEVTGKTFAWQASFQCHTCWSKESACCICSACARTCHQGHKLGPGRLHFMFCDCHDERKCKLHSGTSAPPTFAINTYKMTSH